MTVLEKVKILLGLTDTSKDSLLGVLIDDTYKEVADYTHRDTSKGNMDTAIVQIVVYKYNRLGTEGLSSESYSGVSFGYSEDYPEAIKKLLDSYRVLRLC